MDIPVRLVKLATCAFMLAASGSAQIVPNQYLVILQDAGAGRASTVRTQSVQPMQDRVRTLLQSQNVEILNSYTNLLAGFAVRVPAGGDPQTERARLEALPGVVGVYTVRLRKLLLSTALPIHAVPDAWNAIGGKEKAGAGIKIGIIDTGIDAGNPMFQDSTLSMPPGFPKVNRSSDTAYTNSKVIVARAYPSTDSNITAGDVQAHGTSVASVAAGVSTNSPFGQLSGVAPKAWLGNYKVFPDNGNGAPDSLITQALDDAFADGMDIVNLSLGGQPADPPDVDSLSQIVERAIARGMLVTISAGNEGPDPNTVASPGIATNAITVGASANGRVSAASVTPRDGQAMPALPGSRTLSPGSITASLKDVADLDPTSLACSALPAGSFSGKAALILRGTCNFEDKVANVQAAGALLAIIYTDAARPSPIVMSISSTDLPAVMVSYSNGVQLKQVASSGGSVTVTLSVDTINQVSSFSSRGPGIDGGLKPDLLAVGSAVAMAAPSGTFTVESGTSFSAPMVAGAAALLKAARPGLTVAQYKSLLVNSARPLYISGVSPATNTDSGAGVLQVLAALNAGATISPTSVDFGIGSGTDQLSRSFTVTNVGGQNDTFTLEVVPVNGPAPQLSDSVISLAKGESRNISAQWRVSALQPGTYQGYIRVMGDHALAQERIPYWYGVPSQNVVHITTLYLPDCAKPNASIEVDFRITDEFGLPVTTVTPTAVATGSTTAAPSIAAYQSSRFTPALPGTFALQAVAPATAATQSFSIGAGKVTRGVDVPVSSSCTN